jgi:flagellar biosynthesis protein FlhF
MPECLTVAYRRLVSRGLGEELAWSAVEDAKARVEREGEGAVAAAVMGGVGGMVDVVGDLPAGGRRADGRPFTVALLGATGVGKTTTLAKIAASYKLRFGHRVGLVACDTYRIAAVDQLRAYANIIGLPFRVAGCAQEAEQACHQLSDCDVILVDTAGRSQRDGAKIGELGGLLDRVSPHERHLVLPLTAGAEVLGAYAAGFGGLGATHAILTKADEAVSAGGVVGVLRELGVAVSFVTTGQEVPDEIELATQERIASLVWGDDGVPGVAGGADGFAA